MREEDSNWFSKWEDELPTPEELMPISQTLITPDLASAFDIRNPSPISLFHHQTHQSSSSPQLQSHINNYGVQQHQQQSHSSTPQPQHNSAEFDNSSSAELCGGVGGVSGSELEQARTLKRPRLVWTPQLHKRFVDAVAHLGIKNAVPKTIMQLMSVEGLTRENVASHLQKYRLYLKRMQGPGVGNGPGSSETDRLFASSPVPAHFLHQVNGPVGGGGGNGPNSDRFVSYMPVAVVGHQQVQGQYGQFHREVGQFGLGQSGVGQFDQTFLARQAQLLGPNRNGGMLLQNGSGFVEELELGGGNNNSRKVLTLFPNVDD